MMDKASTATGISPAPEQGQLVEVRQRRYVVTNVVKSALASGTLMASGNGAQHLVTLSSVEDDALGEELQVIWELEPGARVHERTALPEPKGFDEPVRLDAFLDAVRWGAASTADIRSIQSPFRSGIEIEDYQLDPVVRAIQRPRVSLLIADDVGLGKTIEAGLVILELILRHRARTVLVVCPASLQIQWRDQIRDKFGLEFRIVDAELMKNLRRSRGLHANPWKHFPRLITSIDFLKRERPLRLFREILPQRGEPAYPRRFDILVLDEAHNVAPSGRGRYAIDSLRTEAIRLLASHFEHKLFLSATPHNGYPESFSALLELLDNQRFAPGVRPDRDQLGAVMVRRLKSEFMDWHGGPRFAKRTPEAIEVEFTSEEKRIHATLQKYSRQRQQNLADQAEKYATEFVLKLLKKRLFSSPAAFGITLAQHEKSLLASKRSDRRTAPALGLLRRQIDQVDQETDDDTQIEDTARDALEVATRLFREPTANERSLLQEMQRWAESASARMDSKAKTLIRWLENNIRPKGQWSDARVIIFTEYRATQNWLQTILASQGFAGGDRLLTLYGGMDPKERERVKAAFQYDPAGSPVRILLATDAASEGIDLQNYCSRLIHYEIPWNPNRMEQRNGRVDRHGQKAKEVRVYHFVGKGYQQRQQLENVAVGDLEGDLEFLMRAALKVNTIREDLGKVGPVIAEQVEEAMLGQRKALDIRFAERDAEPVRRLLKFERNLREQTAKLMEQFRETQREMRLGPENIQTVVEIALELASQPKLIPANVEGIWPDASGKWERCPVFRLPALKGGWAYCSEGLEHPHTRQIRPIVFDPELARGRDDVVLAHLNHRLVQMSLRLLRAEVWSPEGTKKLHRVTARVVPSNVLDSPAMIAHARLVLIGGDSHRLHEEILAAGGVIQDGRFSRLNVSQVKTALDAALSEEPEEAVKQKLQELWPRHSSSIVQALEARMKERAAALQKTLADRANKETQDITAVMEELERLIRAELKQPEAVQLELWSETEKEQLRRNLDSLQARLAAIPQELEKEKLAIQSRFADPQPRMFTVAVTYLVPEKLARRR